MLRSIFSLIQNIIDSDNKEYNNKKSNTVIYLVSNPDNTLNLDMEIDGQERRNLKSINAKETEESTGSTFTITTDQGDSVTCKHYTDKNIRSTVSKDEGKLRKEFEENVESERASFYNVEEHAGVEVDGDTSGNEMSENQGNKSMDEFMHQLYEKQNRFFERDQDQITALLDQIQKMKKGMERLQEIAQQFNCSEKFKQDVEFLIKNMTTNKNEHKETKLSPTKM